MFPSWLSHGVTPLDEDMIEGAPALEDDDEMRVAIAFNVNAVERGARSAVYQ